MRIEVKPGDVGLAEARPLLASVWTPERLAASSWRDIVTAEACSRILIRDDTGQLVSHIGIFSGRGSLGGREMHIGGIGGVCTRGDCRRRGYASAGLSRAVSYITEELGADFGLLFCNKENYSFYESCGWRRFPGAVSVEQPPGRMAFDISAPYVLGIKVLPVAGPLDLHGLPW